MAHTCNLRYLGAYSRRTQCSSPAWTLRLSWKQNKYNLSFLWSSTQFLRAKTVVFTMTDAEHKDNKRTQEQTTSLKLKLKLKLKRKHMQCKALYSWKRKDSSAEVKHSWNMVWSSLGKEEHNHGWRAVIGCWHNGGDAENSKNWMSQELLREKELDLCPFHHIKCEESMQELETRLGC